MAGFFYLPGDIAGQAILFNQAANEFRQGKAGPVDPIIVIFGFEFQPVVALLIEVAQGIVFLATKGERPQTGRIDRHKTGVHLHDGKDVSEILIE